MTKIFREINKNRNMLLVGNWVYSYKSYNN